MIKEKFTVVYIIGDVRSGSTLLDYLLSFYPNSHSLGELHQLNNYFNKKGKGIERDWKCSCNKHVLKCEFWRPILDKVSFTNTYKTRFNCVEPSWVSINPSIHKWALKMKFNKKSDTIEKKKFSKNIWNLYNAVFDHTGKRLIIDSSKSGSEALFLNKFKEGNIKFLLLEREIGAVSYSKFKRSNKTKSLYNIEPKSIFQYILGSYKVLRRNRMIADLIQENSNENKVMKINYRDLASNPDKIISEISEFLGIETFNIPSRTNQQNEKLHVLGGSPSRHSTSKICVDESWKKYYSDKPLPRLLTKLLNR